MLKSGLASVGTCVLDFTDSSLMLSGIVVERWEGKSIQRIHLLDQKSP
jgi:hypothetical protein